MFEKRILYVVIRGTEMYVHFGFTVSLEAYSKIFNCLNINQRYIFPHCCSQWGKMFQVITYNADYWYFFPAL